MASKEKKQPQDHGPLWEPEEKFGNLAESSPDGVIISDFRGNVCFYNQRAAGIFKVGYEGGKKTGLKTTDFFVNPDTDPITLLESLKNRGSLENYELMLKDRKENHFPASLFACVISCGGKDYIQSIVRDNTRIKKMEDDLRDYAENLERRVHEKTHALEEANLELQRAVEKLEKTREQLAISAHRSGMADVAVSVLHNIGNIINSINVRMYHHREKIEENEVDSLEKIYHLLETSSMIESAARGDLLRKKKLLSYFGATIESLRVLFKELDEDCTFFGNGLEHLMEILSFQQKYAGIRGEETPEEVHLMLQDALDMQIDAILNMKITTECDFVPHALINVNRNKVVQIFINAIKNSCESIALGPENKERLIRMKTSVKKKDGKEYVIIEISDTGSGVPGDVLDKVFRFNFSTKERGRGFGLHDAANYINARNGRISLHSDGIGKGARVLIELPLYKGDLFGEQ